MPPSMSDQSALERHHAELARATAAAMRQHYQEAIEIASRLIREVGFEPVLIGGLDKGKFLMPGTPLAGERTPAEVKKVAASL